MIKITNGKSIIEVTKGAYKEIYIKQGYEPCDEIKEDQDDSGASDDEVTEEENGDVFAELLEKPLAQWSGKEIEEFAAAHGVDLTDFKKVEDKRGELKTYLESDEFLEASSEWEDDK